MLFRKQEMVRGFSVIRDAGDVYNLMGIASIVLRIASPIL